MRLTSLRLPLKAIGLLLASLCSAGCSGNDATQATTTGGDPGEFTTVPKSCAYDCPASGCSEATTPYACPSLGAWNKVPHAETCAAWDGKPPAAKAGQCTASDPTGEALKYTGADPSDPSIIVMPDGRRQRPFGASWAFREPDVYAGMTSNVIAIPGSSLVITVDTGYGDHVVRLVDAALIGQGDPVAGRVMFPDPSTLNWGMAFVAPDRAYVATDNGVVQAFHIDVAARTIALDDMRSITLPPSTDTNGNPASWYASGVAASPDGKRLVVSPVSEKQLLVYDVDPASAGYGQQLGTVNLGESETFGVWFDPLDLVGQRAYVSMWADRAVIEVELDNPAQPVLGRTFAAEKDPQGVAFLDARWMVIANDFGDSFTLVDRVSGAVTHVPVDTTTDLHGSEPSTLAYDAMTQRLYVTLAGIAALGVYSVDLSANPPSIVPAGRLPTLWWPSGVVVQDDSSIVISSLRGQGKGASTQVYTLNDGDAYLGMHGGVQRILNPSMMDLATGEAAVKASNEVGKLPGYPAVTCPAGANDFPVPATNTEGKSPVIDHIFIILRENKTFDALFGDFPGVKGDPSFTLKTSKADMDSVWGNLRALAGRFALSDNFYIDAEISSLGHAWVTYGRSSDYNERTWAMASYGRTARPGDVQNGGVVDVGRPEEGSMFEWLGRNNIPFDVFGEGVGITDVYVPGHPPNDFKYPGGFIQNITYPDNEKACYVAGRLRILCDLGSVAFMTLPNDHTVGVSPDRPTPETMCAVNDEATGMVIEAISKSPLWRSSLIFVTEDDTAQGGDHVDGHRTFLLVASPWVKRGYVSNTHIDISSMHKIIAHVLGLPYPNVIVENSGLPRDMFTSTPDYTPFDHIPRSWPLACGGGASAPEAKKTQSWDISDVDRSPGLDAQVGRWMRGRQIPEPRDDDDDDFKPDARRAGRAGKR